jgi:hypothetical protein
MSYNGWKNYETWAVALWIDNEESSHRYRSQLAERAQLLARNSDQSAKMHLADMVKDWITDKNPLIDQPTVYSDLLNSSLEKVDWLEIAENFLSD